MAVSASSRGGANERSWTRSPGTPAPVPSTSSRTADGSSCWRSASSPGELPTFMVIVSHADDPPASCLPSFHLLPEPGEFLCHATHPFVECLHRVEGGRELIRAAIQPLREPQRVLKHHATFT